MPVTDKPENYIGCWLQEDGKDRWNLKRKLGEGAFGAIFEATDKTTPGVMVAVKFEHQEEPVQLLRMEVVALKKIRGKHILRLLDYGRINDWNYMVMQLLGKSLDKLKKDAVGGKFRLSTAVRLTKQALEGIEDVHTCGFLHRDIKPANFAMGRAPYEHKNLYVIDFGMARQYINSKTGQHRRPRSAAGFRGTLNYAPVAAHRSKDVGRKDDLWSILYMAIELITGTLPWRSAEDADETARLKEGISTRKLLKECPQEYYEFHNHLCSLKFSDKPNYEHLYRLLDKVMQKHKVKPDDPWDWEKSITTSTATGSRST